MTDEQYKLYQQQREQFSYTRDYLLTIRDSVTSWPKLPGVPELITEEDAISEAKNDDNKFIPRGGVTNPNSFSRNRRREHSDRDWDQLNKEKHIDHNLAHDWRQDKESERESTSRSDRDWKDKSDVKGFRRDSQPISERDKDWLDKKDRKEGWNYVGKTDARSRRGHTSQESSEPSENSESIVLGPPRKVFPSSQPGSANSNVAPSNVGTPSKRHERNPSHRNSEKNYVNFATERPPTKRTANIGNKLTREESDQPGSKLKTESNDSQIELNRQLDASTKNNAKESSTNFVDSLFQTENSQKFSWDELMVAFNGNLSLPTQTSKFDTILESDATNDSDQETDESVSVSASRGFGRWFSSEPQPKATQKQQAPAEPASTNSSSATGKQNVDSDSSGNILQELLQTALQGNQTLQMAQQRDSTNQTVQIPQLNQPQSESQSFIASLLSKPAQSKVAPVSSERKMLEPYSNIPSPQVPNANPPTFSRPPQFIPPQYPMHSPHAPPTSPYYQMAPHPPSPSNNAYSHFFQPNPYQPNPYQQQYHPSPQFHAVPSAESPNLLDKLFGGVVQGSVSLP
eukprot:CAMPEP_0168565504 /NCGR_PEP_ID=MMETSP0413-20121227/13882_1 /TAXON_ID=136452 /ORGANISM="Filamoeba nolandi, Strain NC-AS-23-1" /LENGTH=571 /DNA_ID=CAMNT_0008597383 /DNA_START=115 /DNA_END=1826 /DNA_ORIENTATION=-